MAKTEQTAPLLAAPLEIREQIFKEVLSNPFQRPDLLRTCRWIYTEAHKFLYQRPIVFRGQPALYEWLDRAPEKHLSRVRDIIIELREVDMQPLLTPADTATAPPSGPRLLTWELHDSELDKLRTYLSKLPRVTELTLRAPSDRHSFLYEEFLTKFLELLGPLWPGLSGLTLQGNFHQQDLTFLHGLPQLQSFSFSGFSASSATETADILSSLHHLTHLVLVLHPTMLTPTDHVHSFFSSKRQFFSDQILRFLNPLTSLSLVECIQPNTSAALFFTAEFLASLRAHASLHSFSICLNHTPGPGLVAALQEFVAQSAIRRLEVDWPALETDVLGRLLGRGLVDFWVRVESSAEVSMLLYALVAVRDRGDAPWLRRVVFVRDGRNDVRDEDKGGDADDDAQGEDEEEDDECGEDEDEEDKEDVDADAEEDEDETNTTRTSVEEDDIALAIKTLASLGVKVSWCTEGV